MRQPQPLESPNLPVQESAIIYERAGVSFGSSLQWHLVNGVVFSDSDTFITGFGCDMGDPMRATPDANCLHVTMIAGSMFKGLLHFADKFDYVCFKRDTRGSDRIRFYEMSRMLSKL
jgi:hypothetical protein